MKPIVFDKFYQYTLIFSILTISLMIYNHWMPILGAGLFTIFILDLLQTKLKEKRTTLIASIFVFLTIFLGLIQFGIYLKDNFDELFNINLDQFKPIFSYLKMPIPSDFDINYLLKMSLEYIKNHLNILSAVGTNSLQILVGILFGVLFFLYKEKQILAPENYWFKTTESFKFYLNNLFEGFKTIMRLQFMVAFLNTISLSILSFVIAPIFTGDLLPYWYILLPLTAIFSLIPVIGNLIINVLIFFISINVSILFSVIAIIYFFVVHKLELFAIAKLLGKKEDIPFLFIALSMLLGELYFQSMLGILLGITFLLATRNAINAFQED